LVEVSASNVVVAVTGVGVGDGVGVGVGAGVGVGVGVGAVDPLLVVVVVAGVVKFDPAPPQPVMIANEIKVQKQIPSREIWSKISPPEKRREYRLQLLDSLGRKV
jgi:hypothetical protein